MKAHLKALCIFALLAWSGAPGRTFANSAVEPSTDPVFLLSFKPSDVRFEPVSADLGRLCHLPKVRPYWVFSHVTEGDTQYYIVGSYDDDHGYGTGLGLKLNGPACLTENAENVFTANPPAGGYETKSDAGQLPGLVDTLAINAGHKPVHWNRLHSPGEERVYKALVSDALVRARRAWNNDKAFKARLCAPDHLALFDDASLMLSEVKSICADGRF